MLVQSESENVYKFLAQHIQDICRRVEGCETDADFALGILSIVGVTLSLFGLAVTIFTMIFFK